MEKVEERESEGILSYWALMRLKFLKNKLAVGGAATIVILYAIFLPAEFMSPYFFDTRNAAFIAAPPQRVRFIDNEGKLQRPFVYGLKKARDPKTFRRIYTIDTEKKFPIRLFARGVEYNMWFFIKTDIHLFGVREEHMFLLGTDPQGRDMVSRIIYGGRASMTIGLIGVIVGIIMGILMGLISGYIGGRTDDVIQRGIEVMLAFPPIPLWLALTASLPKTWDGLQVYFAITIILSFISWGTIARVIRGMTLSLKSEESILAAKANGANTWWIVIRHLLPGNISYVIVAATLTVPAMILGETALSFLGVGLRPPITSWGTLLQQAQDITVIAHQPWLIIPVAMVIISVLAFNFMGDGLRDAADPFSSR